MNDKIIKFMEYVSSDETVMAELNGNLTGRNEAEQVSEIIRFAKEHGHELTEEDFETESGELGEDELEAVVGGGFCVCPFLGSGSGDGLKCGCGGGGTGGMWKITHITSQGGCFCVVAGAGATNRH